MHRFVKFLLATALVALCVWIWFAPHLTVHAMRKAAERGDAEALSSHVDFPALRESVRGQLAARVSDRLGGNSGWRKLGADFATTLASPAIDAMVSPEALAMIFAGRDMRDRYAEPADAPPPAANGDGDDTHGGLDTRHWRLSMGYDDLSTFSVKVDTGDSEAAPSRLVFKRHYLLWWKLSGIELPAVDASDRAAP
jgi:hypothetical protein